MCRKPVRDEVWKNNSTNHDILICAIVGETVVYFDKDYKKSGHRNINDFVKYFHLKPEYAKTIKIYIKVCDDCPFLFERGTCRKLKLQVNPCDKPPKQCPL